MTERLGAPAARILRPVIEDPYERRSEYETVGLDVSDVAGDPIVQFSRWFEEAAAVIPEANAMVLSTAGPAGPSSRAVLLRGVRNGRFVFYTNRSSRKGRDIAADPRVSLLFPWFALHRQLRIDGVAAPVPDEVSDAYFASRPRASQAGAVASPQSEPIPSREWLEERVGEVLESGPIARPEWWGGYAVEPALVELWQGRPNRLHDRIRYVRRASDWAVERVAP